MDNQTQMSDIEILKDTLADHKCVNASYNMFANECQNTKLRNDVLKLLIKEHELQAEIFDLLHQMGGYPIKEAGTKEISEAVSKVTKED